MSCVAGKEMANSVPYLPRTMKATDLEHCPALFGKKSAVEAASKPEPENRKLVLEA